MITQEEIYDLDTETLEQRVDFLQNHMRKWSPRSKKKGERCLQLAKLEIEEREVNILLSEFETKFSTINFLYLEKQTKLEKNLSVDQRKLNLQSKGFVKQKHHPELQPIKKTFTIPKIDDSLQYKPIKTKKIPNIGNVKLNSKTLNVDNKSKSSSINYKTSNRVQPAKPIKQQRESTKTEGLTQSSVVFELINERIQKQPKQDKKLVNKVQFIQNEQSMSSDENQQQTNQDIFQPELIVTSQNFQEQQKFNISQILNRQEEEYSRIDSITYISKKQQRKLHSNTDSKQNSKKLETIDYFRFPVVNKKTKQHYQTIDFQSKDQYQEPEQQRISLTLSLNQYSNTTQISKPQTVCLSQRVIPQIPLSSSCDQRSLSQHIVNRKQKAIYRYQPTFKIVRQLPVPTMTYHDIIPTFNHLFPPNSDVFGNMRILVGILDQHLKMKSLLNSQNDQTQLYDREQFSSKYSHLINIELSKQTYSTPYNPQNSSSLYYRVIKTKQQVYEIITNTLNRANWSQLPHGMNLKQSWNLLWTWSKPQIDFKTLIYFQKVNHFINNKQISRKDLLKKNIEKIKRLGVKIKQTFNIIPDTYLLPGETDNFIKKFKECDGQKENIWIMKPIGLSRGRGIKLVKDLNDIYYNQPIVLQKYLKNPLLLNGYKFDMRIYVLVTNINPLQTYIYKQGFARLSTQPYTLSNLDNNFIHLTNYSIQRQNIKSPQSLGGSKISLKMLSQKLQKSNISWNLIWSQITQIVLKSLIACMNEIPSVPNCFELFGYDIIIDSELKCWLLEVNSSPSLEKEYLLDELIKQQLIDDIVGLVDVVGFDRGRLKEVLERRVMEVEGRKSYINTRNNSVEQLNRDLCYVLDGKELRRYGERKSGGNFEQVAPGEEYFKLIKMLQSYKNTNIIKK